ncbi:lipase family protein [Nocardioides sp. B-3]|uniref:lipase family protein n=1 Tax=Nocardioides sp. B-3 TaxID=2895565 RepID=UPI0021533B21|nr:lipase family protein [Nocardioides sp. B-3]
MIAELKEECVIETVLTHGFIQSSTLTLDGRSVPTMLRDPEWNQMISDQLIGNGRKPSVPTLVFHSGTDDVVPYGAGLGTAQRWCAQGANVTFRTGFLLGHIGGAFEYYPNALKFLEDRLAGVPVTSNCSTI